ncbi:MAG: Na+/H+ antiporter NhaA [Pseudomonadota bacterium]|nr:Na+/H+ antiporter NhaA [Pseudomonadota bacterium]
MTGELHGIAGTYIRTEVLSGVLLLLATALALVAANSDFRPVYQAWLDAPLGLGAGEFRLHKPLLLWINDGLMAVFFLLVGLEIRREFTQGELSSPRKAVLPVAAALGGMIMPALIYMAISRDMPDVAHGWAIPVATDIAFALGILALAGRRVPPSLRLFLLALAIMDDLGAIVIIALFYSHDLAALPLVLASGVMLAMVLMNRGGISRLWPYLVMGAMLWVCVLKSGIHTTLAGVILAMTIPAGKMERLEARLHAPVSYMILPLFAFANAGVPLEGVALASVLQPLPLGIALGLFLGKQAGVFLSAWMTVRFNIARLPAGASWRQLYGAAILTGIGFTMSLFIGMLAFDDGQHVDAMRLGVLTGSLLSAVVGFLWLRLCPSPPEKA